MKKRRVLLHTCILLLAVVCMGAGMYAGYYQRNGYADGYEDKYNYGYASNLVYILHYGYAQSAFREQYADDSKVLIENKELGDVTVKDIKQIFVDKYSYYYDYRVDEDDDIYFEDYDDYEEYYGEEEYGDSTPETLYEMDYFLMKKYKKQWQSDATEESRKKYEYYEEKCKCVDAYANVVLELVSGFREDNGSVKQLNDTSFLLNDTYPTRMEGMDYFIQYTLNGEQYTITNVDGEELFRDSNRVVDVTTKENGVLTQNNPLYGSKAQFIQNFIEKEEKAFLEQVDHMYVAIDIGTEGTYFYNLLKKIENQPTDAEIKEIRQNVQKCFVVILLTLLVAFVLYILLLIMAGHKQKGDAPQLCESDKCWWDLECFIMVVVGFIVFLIIEDKLWDEGYYKVGAICDAIVALPAIELFVLMSESLMRRFKTRTFMQTTLFGRVWNVVKILMKKLKIGIHNLLENLSLTVKVVVLGIAIFIWQLGIIYVSYDYDFDRFFLFEIITTGGICYLVWRYFNENKIVEEGAKKIADGELDYKIDGEMKFRQNRVLKDCVNNIGEGLNAAVEASIQNERMKTELITNVSHDLKTPLTSIINYVDLLKTEGLDSEKAGKYLDVLDQKSQRLKHLTEDLVEVSKLNSGAVELEREKLDIVQLVRQSLGEYDEKFARKDLQVVKTVQEEPVYVLADGRKTWRLFENLYENVYKYAMVGTRVYIDVKTESGKVVISVKNISESPLNFSANELMERFVRGDISRTTEGSGLGLSIAKSIVERQDGEMKIVLDGDLFKVEIMMNIIK